MLRQLADDELVLATALHDIGRADAVRRAHPGLSHELAGGAFARSRLTERIAWLIEQHVPAKRFLSTDAGYQARLTPTSQVTLSRQGGPMSASEAARFRQHPWAADAIRLRQWDDDAKCPDVTGMPLADLLTLARRWAASNGSRTAARSARRPQTSGRPAR